MAEDQKKVPPIADRLVYYARESGAPLFTDQNGEAHILVNGEALPISRANRWLTALIYEREDRAPTNDGLVGAKRVLDMIAHRDGFTRELHTRAAFHEGAVFYQLGPGRVVKIDEEGWRLEPAPPVTFRSVKNLRELPDPVPDGNLSDVADLVHLKTERDRRLFLTHITLVALAHIPRPILQATGVMGAGKSTACRVVKRMMDPTSTESVTVDRRDFLQKASHCYILMLDNQNSLPDWALDTLCRLVTGESDSKRVLYTDEEDLVWSMKRGVLLNGINAPSERGDVQDRTLPIELDRIDKRQRLPEDDFWIQFSLKHPEMLGAIFDTLAGALRERHTVELAERPRLADWGLYAAALYQAQGWGVEQFVCDWQGVEDAQHQGTLDGSMAAQAVIIYMLDKDRVEKPASKLHASIEAFVEDDLDLKADRDWPKTGRTLWKKIREVTPLLESYGIRASRKNDNRIGRPITLQKIGDGGDKYAKHTDDSADDNPLADDNADDNFTVSSAHNPHEDADADDNPSYGRYFGRTISSDREEENKHTERIYPRPESSPDLSSASSPSTSSGGEATKTRRRLTEEEVQEVQKLISQGMAPRFAREAVIGSD
jgi:hypothetical protein